ncbi:hypothetical protein SNEBB_009351 [Seison nebaliae]|nr:hypothetical protein SNEBB_009351 [Seison nebaliae]
MTTINFSFLLSESIENENFSHLAYECEDKGLVVKYTPISDDIGLFIFNGEHELIDEIHQISLPNYKELNDIRFEDNSYLIDILISTNRNSDFILKSDTTVITIKCKINFINKLTTMETIHKPTFSEIKRPVQFVDFVFIKGQHAENIGDLVRFELLSPKYHFFLHKVWLSFNCKMVSDDDFTLIRYGRVTDNGKYIIMNIYVDAFQDGSMNRVDILMKQVKLVPVNFLFNARQHEEQHICVNMMRKKGRNERLTSHTIQI